MTTTKTLLSEENPVSLCSAFVLDDGYVVSFGLMPRQLRPAFPGDRNCGKYKGTYLYRRRRPLLSRLTLTPLGEHQEWAFSFSRSRHKRRAVWEWVGHFCYRRFLVSLEKDIEVRRFDHNPRMRLLWSDNGQSVALFLDERPWAFIRHDKNHGYSKGVLRPGYGNTWEEPLFEQTFGEHDY
jgi:hypothetical protein